MDNHCIVLEGLQENNLKNIDLRLPKGKLIVFTSVSGSGKSSMVFDTIAEDKQSFTGQFLRSDLAAAAG